MSMTDIAHQNFCFKYLIYDWINNWVAMKRDSEILIKKINFSTGDYKTIAQHIRKILGGDIEYWQYHLEYPIVPDDAQLLLVAHNQQTLHKWLS